MKLQQEAPRQIVKVNIAKQDGEYICRAYDQWGRRFSAADYYTDDKQDATDTAAAMIESGRLALA